MSYEGFRAADKYKLWGRGRGIAFGWVYFRCFSGDVVMSEIEQEKKENALDPE
jgi:hypothetical protein